MIDELISDKFSNIIANHMHEIKHLREDLCLQKRASDCSVDLSSGYSFLDSTSKHSTLYTIENEDRGTEETLQRITHLVDLLYARTQQMAKKKENQFQNTQRMQRNNSSCINKNSIEKKSVRIRESQATLRVDKKIPQSSNKNIRNSRESNGKSMRYISLKDLLRQSEPNTQGSTWKQIPGNNFEENQQNNQFQVDENQNYIKSQSTLGNIQAHFPTFDSRQMDQTQNFLRQLEFTSEQMDNLNYQKKILRCKSNRKYNHKDSGPFSLNSTVDMNKKAPLLESGKNSHKDKENYLNPLQHKGVYQQILSLYSTARLLAMKKQ